MTHVELPPASVLPQISLPKWRPLQRVRILFLNLRLALITSTTFNMLMLSEKTLQYLFGQGIIFLFEVSSNFLLLF